MRDGWNQKLFGDAIDHFIFGRKDNGSFAAMALLYTLFAKFVPIISIWEMKVGNQPHPETSTATEDEMSELWKVRP